MNRQKWKSKEKEIPRRVKNEMKGIRNGRNRKSLIYTNR